MKNSLIVTILMALALTFSAKANYVFTWNVNESSVPRTDYSYIAIAIKQATGDTSYLMSSADTESVSVYAKGGEAVYADVTAYFDNVGAYKSNDYADYSYALTLFNSDFSQVLATSYWYNLDTLLADAKIYENGSAAKQEVTVNTVNYNSIIPEPTSGLLLLIGGALLALKRKRA